MTDTVRFSLDDPADVSSRYLVRSSKSAIKVFGEDGHFGSATAGYMTAFNSSYEDGNVDPGPVWEIPKDEYRQHWFDVPDNRIFSYLMLGLPGWTASVAYQGMGAVPTPDVVYKMYCIAGKQRQAYADLATAAGTIIRICDEQHGLIYSAGAVAVSLDMVMQERHLKKEFQQHPERISWIIATCLAARSRFSSSRMVQMSVEVALSAYLDLEALGHCMEQMDPDDLHNYLSLCCTPQDISEVFLLKGLESGVIGAIADIMADESVKGRLSTSRDLFRVAKLVTEGVPVEWAIPSVIEG